MQYFRHSLYGLYMAYNWIYCQQYSIIDLYLLLSIVLFYSCYRSFCFDYSKNSIKHMNFWNLKHTKQRLAILQRTQAQKKHLINIIKAKSIVKSEANSGFRPHHSRNLNGSMISQPQSLQHKILSRYQLDRHNRFKIKKLENLDKIVKTNNHSCDVNQNNKSLSMDKSRGKFTNITRSISNNHNIIFGINKRMKEKKICEQNTKMFSRLISTTPTIKRSVWKQNNIDTLKYKQNMNKSKYLRPDYSIEACKMLRNNSNKLYHMKILRNNIGTVNIRGTGTRNLKSQGSHLRG